MPIDASIPLSGKPAQIESPFQAAGQFMSLQDAMQRRNLYTQQIQAAQLENVARQNQLNAEGTVQKLFLDNGGDWDKTRAGAAGRVPMSYLQKMDADHLTVQRTLLGLENEKRMAIKNANDLVGPEAAAILQAPPEQRPQLYTGALARLQKAGIDTTGFDAAHIPTDEDLKAIVARSNYTGQVLNWAEKKAQTERQNAMAQRATEQAAAISAKEQMDLKQRAREEAARGYQLVTDDDSHQKWLDSLPETIKPEYSRLDKYDQSNQDVLDNMALSARERTTNFYTGERLENQAANSRVGLANKAADPTLSPDERKQAQDALDLLNRGRAGTGAAGGLTPNAAAIQDRYNRTQSIRAATEATKDADAHTKYQTQEQTQWAMVKRYEAVAKDKADTDSITDPVTGKAITVLDAKAVASAARAKANTLSDAAKQLRAKHQWGEFGQQPAPAPAVPSARPSSAYKPGQVVSIKGVPHKISAVHPDGSFDADPVK